MKLGMNVHFISSVAGVIEGLENNPSKTKGYLNNMSELILSPKTRRAFSCWPECVLQQYKYT